MEEFKKVGNEVKNFEHLNVSNLPEADKAVISKDERFFGMITEKGNHGNILLVWNIENRKKS